MGCHLRFDCASISIATVVAVKMGGGGGGGMRRDCRGGRGELTIMVCTLQGNYAEGGGVTKVCGWGILWDACPLILLCVCVRAGCVREKEETTSGAHAATKYGNIFKLYV